MDHAMTVRDRPFTGAELDPARSELLAGEIVLVTGASSGLGHRFARTLAANGAQVAAAARRVDRIEALARRISADGGRCFPIPLDVADPYQCLAVFERVEAELGSVTTLVNNAGITDAQYATKMSVELVDQLLATNVRAPYVLSTELARRLIRSDRPGRIVNISSIGAFHYGGQAASLYSITKAAINRMTETLAVEWARYHINVNAIAPGSFASEMSDGMIARVGEFAHRFPRARLGDPSQLDSTILYLLSPASELVTGTIIKVDDGQTPR